MSDNDHEPRRTWCPACSGEGGTPDPKLAVLGGAPQTVVVERRCRWCDGSGRQRGGFQPPV